jgi:ATP-binding cassette subfamily B protein
MTPGFVRRMLRPYRLRLAMLAVLALASSSLLLTIPWLAGTLVGELIGTGDGDGGRLFFLVAAALAGFSALSIANGLVSAATAVRVVADVRVGVFDHLLHLPMGYFDQHRKGDVLALATTEISKLGRFLTGTLVAFPARLFTAIGASFLIFRIDPVLALLAPIAVPVFYLCLKIVGRRLRGLAVANQKADAAILGKVDETLDMLPMVKVFTRERLEREHFRSQAEHAAGLQIRQGRIYAILEPLVILVAGLFLLALLYLGGERVTAGTMSGADLFTFLLYTALLTRPVGALAHIYGEVQTARGTLLRLENLLSRTPEPGYAFDTGLPPATGAISFRGVSFHYPGRERFLADLNLDVSAGETVALVGPNGAGKTTLVHLLCRFYAPTSGQILLDGVDIATVRLADLRRRIALVPQRAMLLNASVRDNIVYGRHEAGDDDFRRALRLAQAEEFIAALPNGIDTTIGDRGVRLSGGQRQRIALARALIKDPHILILDEATSMFDLEAEQDFVLDSQEAFHGRTVIIITHRPGSLAVADRVIEIANCGAVEIARQRAADKLSGSGLPHS